MNNVVFDIGNSNIVIGILENDEKKVYRFNTISEKTEDEYNNTFKEVFRKINVDTILITSVVPTLTSTITKYCRKYLNVTPKIVGPGYKSGVMIKTDNPKEVGSDLICGVAGAMKFSKAGIVIDLGTATKISYYNNCEFLGVIIAPGISISASVLTASASQLSDFSIAKPQRIFGKNTVECLQSGVVYGHIAMLNGLIELIRNEFEGNLPPVYLTGGLSGFVKNDLNFKIQYEPDLIIDALLEMIEKNME